MFQKLKASLIGCIFKSLEDFQSNVMTIDTERLSENYFKLCFLNGRNVGCVSEGESFERDETHDDSELLFAESARLFNYPTYDVKNINFLIL
jgi:hypothetical protein